MRQTIGFIVAALLGATGLHVSHRAADLDRHEITLDSTLMYMPSGRSLEIASLGFQEVIADFLWIRTVLVFGERWGTDSSTEWAVWMRGMLNAIHVLDPKWRTPFFYGGMMLRISNDIEGSDQIFLAASEALPDDPFFPFALGMNYYLNHNDPETAAKWVLEASRRPGAPAWYGAAAAGFLARNQQRGAAIRFLKEEIDATENPAVSKELAKKLNELVHDELAERLEGVRREYGERMGHDIQAVSELGDAVPPDPLGGVWILGYDDKIRSSEREASDLEKVRSDDRRWLVVDGG